MIGQVLNQRYQIMEKVGEGGMAITYRSKDLLLDRVVAVKVMREQFAADPEFVERFLREARAAANLADTTIAGVYDTGQDQGLHYIVMEFVEGRNLKQAIKREGPIPAPGAVDIAIQVAQALVVAHSRGIIHRDIKPHNVILAPQGKVKVTDFGIAKALSAPSSTETGTILGSVHYFSPEQARGDPVGPQADLYSLGVVLFEMLTGRLPFEGENPVAVAHKQIYDRPPSPRSFNPQVPHEMEHIILRCLEKDLSRRYASASELLSYLTSFQSRQMGERTAVALPIPPSAPAVVLPRAAPSRRRVLLPVAGALLLLGAAAAAFVILGRGHGLPQVQVPKVIGLDLKSARAVLMDMGLTPAREPGLKYSEEVEAGSVADQDPPPGSLVLKGGVVRLWLGKGPARVPVPEVGEGAMKLEAARRELEQADLRAGRVIEEYDETIPKGYVISTDPKAGEKVPRGTPVVLVVSKGPKPVEPPVPLAPPEERTGTVTFDPQKAAPHIEPEGSQATIELEDEEGNTEELWSHTIRRGDPIPPQSFTYKGKVKVRLKIEGKMVEEREFGQEPPSPPTTEGPLG